MKNLNTILLILSALVLSGCNYFSNDKKEKLEAKLLKYKKEAELDENKNFEYSAKSISYKYNIPKDTVIIVLKEYYKEYEGYSFNEKSNKLEESDFPIDEIHKLDFIKRLVNVNKINERTAYTVFNEIDLLHRLEWIEDDISSTRSDIEDIESQLSK